MWQHLSRISVPEDRRPLKALSLGNAQSWPLAGVRVSSNVTAGELSPDKPPWFNCSSKGYHECLHNIWLPLLLTPGYQGTDQHHLLSSQSYKASLCAKQGGNRLPEVAPFGSLPPIPRKAGGMLLLLSSEDSPNTICTTQWTLSAQVQRYAV